MARARSPQYPAIGLAEAVDRMTALTEKIDAAEAEQKSVLRGLGYTTANGASMAAISALRKYGLLLKSGGKYRLSALAHRVLDKDDRSSALQEAIRKPSL